MNRNVFALSITSLRRACLLLLALALIPSGARPQDISSARPNVSAAPYQAFRELRDLPYVPNAAPRQRLDLYLPASTQAEAARPLIVWIHGGAWRIGTKDVCPAARLVPLGYAAASIEYRFSQDAPFPAQIQDCKAAIRWLRAHSREYGIDPSRIGVWGASAGGHLVALLGVTGHVSDFDSGPNLDQSSAVQCVIDFFGPTDFLHYGDPADTFGSPGNAVTQLLGGPFSTHQAVARSASPIYFVTRNAAPFLILQGDQDPLVPMEQSVALNAALRRAGVPSTLHVVKGGGHGGPGFSTLENWKLIVNFLARYLKPQG